MHTTHTSKSQSLGKSYISHEENTRNMQLEIDHLHKRLHHERQKMTPSNSNPSSKDEQDGSYKPRSKTPSSESFSYDEDNHSEWRSKSPPHKGLDNDTMSRAIN